MALIVPEGFDDSMRDYARMTRPSRMYVQGLALRNCGVWLDIDGVHTIIGYGSPDAALAEAERWAEQQLQNVRQEIENRKALPNA